jgi:hypothetical protein
VFSDTAQVRSQRKGELKMAMAEDILKGGEPYEKKKKKKASSKKASSKKAAAKKKAAKK